MKVTGTEHQGASIRPGGRSAPVAQTGYAKRDRKLWKACQNFESLFMGYLVKSMERTLPQGSLSGSGLPDIMFNQVMGSALSEGGGMGLAELLYRDLQSKHPQTASDNGEGISLEDLLLRSVRKDNNDETASR